MPHLLYAACAVLFLAVPASGGPASVERAAARLAASFAVPASGRAVAVIPFRSPDGSISLLGGMLADRVTAGLIKAGGVTVLDRRYISRVMGELELGAAGVTEGGGEAGRFTGAQYLVAGSLLRGEDGSIAVSARLVSTADGRAAASGSAVLPAEAGLDYLYSRISAADSEAEAAAGGIYGGAYYSDRDGGGCRWVRASSHMPGAPALAKAKAMLAARRRAAVFAGMPGRPAIIISEEAGGRRDGDGWTAALEACARPSGPAQGRGLAAELLLSRETFASGESASAVITVTAPAYVFLYNTDPGGAAALAYRGRAEAGRPLLLPRDGGTELKAAVPEGETCSSEAFYVFAVKAGGPAPEPPAYSPLSSVFSFLDALGPDWASDARAFSVCR